LAEAKNELIKQSREKALRKRKTTVSVEPASKRQSKKVVNNGTEQLPPHKILFLEKLPEDIQQATLVDIFQKFPGFVEVRLFTVKHLGFVEYETDEQAVLAKTSTEGLEMGGNKVKITYAKK
jgi:U2 small nuclear ribonucleoprotein B''